MALIEAQADNTLGLSHLIMREPKKGKFELVTGILFKLVI